MVALRFYIDSLRVLVRSRTGWINRFSPWLHSRPTTASFSVQPFNPVASLQAVNGTSYRTGATPPPLRLCLPAVRPLRPHPTQSLPFPLHFSFQKLNSKKFHPASLPFPHSQLRTPASQKSRALARHQEEDTGREGRTEQNRTAAEEAPHHVA